MKPPLYKGKSWLGAGQEIQQSPLELYPRIHGELGPVIRVKILPGMEMYSLASPEAMEHVLRKNQRNYPKPDIFHKAVKPLTGNGLFTNDNFDNWHFHRKLIAPQFHHRQIAGMVGIMAEETENLAAVWEKDTGKPRDILEDMMFLTLNIVSRTLFSTDVMAGAGRISDAVREAFEYVGYRLNTPFSLHETITGTRKKRFRKAKEILDTTIHEMITERQRSSEPGDDMLGLLLMARDEETGKGMDAEQLLDELLTLMIAGHETTASALAWSWYLLAKNESRREILNQEVSGFTHSGSGEGNIPAIPDYAKWVFEESMRLYPPAWGVPREATEDDVIEGFKIQKGKVINCSFYAMFRDEKVWKNALAFEPERFEDSRMKEMSRFAYIPFGMGRRQCIGMNMAMVEGPLILAMLAGKFSLNLPENGPEIIPDTTFALRPQGKLMMNIFRN